MKGFLVARVCFCFVPNCVTHVKGRTWPQDIEEECAEDNAGLKKQEKVEKGENWEMKIFMSCTSERALLR